MNLAIVPCSFLAKSANWWRNGNCFTALCAFLIQIHCSALFYKLVLRFKKRNSSETSAATLTAKI
jgi:hypothetical protein